MSNANEPTIHTTSPWEYAATYCRADVDVLQKGWKKFREMVLSEMDMDINCYPTVASMTDA